MATRIGRMHPQANAVMNANRRPSKWGVKGKPVPLLRISDGNREEARHFFSALFYSLERHNHSVPPIRNDRPIEVLVSGEPIKIELYEPDHRNLTKASRRYILEVVDRVPLSRAQKRWTSRELNALQMKIPSIVEALEHYSPLIRQARHEHRERLSLEKAQEETKVIAANRMKLFQDDLNGWQSAVSIRKFIAHISEADKAIGKENQVPKSWTEWATEIANQSDPLRQGLNAFVARYGFEQKETT